MVMTTQTISADSLSEAVQQCRQQQKEWARLSVRRRLQPVRAFRRLLVTEWKALCAAVAHDIEKPFDECLAGEVLPLAAACRFLQHAAPRLLRPRRVGAFHRPLWLWGQSDKVWRQPRGLIGIIGTWNYPVFLNGVQILQAVTAGNAVLWKPSELAPSSAEVLFDLISRAGFPANLVQMLPATREAGQELANADIDHVVFTGSSATGRRLAETLGRRLVSSTMELSGCDAVFVLDDADVDLAARAAWFGATVNRGQTCIACRRVLVQRNLYSAFADAIKPLLGTAKPMRLALESQAQQATRLVHDASAEGACLLEAPAAPDENGDNSFCKPTVVLDARPEMAVCKEASFAPILAVLPFDDVEEALQMDAQCPYGLGAAVFTRSPERARCLAPHLKVGMVMINDVVVPTAHPATSFGGRGESGWGVTQGAEGLLEMTVPQVVSARGGKLRPHYGSATGNPPLPVEGFQGLLEWSHGATFRQRAAGLWRVIRSARKKPEPLDAEPR
jgi:acyl-CoA reductase-like NAD-dependent aldehyde dehydrogenase